MNTSCKTHLITISAISGVLVALCTPSARSEATYSKDFKLTDSFGVNPYSVQNAFLRTEPFGTPVRYWQPSSPGVWGEVVYKFDVGFVIDSASSSIACNAYTSGADVNFDNGAQAFVDVSIDGVNYTNVLGSYPGHGGGTPALGDISALVDGFDVIYVRSRLFMTTNYGSFGTAQFLRSDPQNGFNVTATGVPEPGTSAMLAAGLVPLFTRFRNRVRASN